MAASMGARSPSGSFWRADSTLARPLLGLAPIRSRVAPCSAKTSAKKVRTAWPKMIGSETFIIVALRCSEKRTPLSWASSSWAARKSHSCLRLITVASRISPASSATGGRSSVTEPSSATWRRVTSVGASTVTDRSLERKSPASMVATCVLESGDQGPSRCGCFLA